MANYPAVTPAVYREMGLNDSEYALIVETLGREPSYTEVGMYSVMWSEHCGYKYSRPVLKAFAEYRKAQESGALENAGVVPLGDTGYGIVFKMESHNHPSAVEPFQGAATGVGGILRDIFTMGARPIANLNSLRFGPIEGDSPHAIRNRYLFEHVVKGVGDYGNCLLGTERFIWRDASGIHFDTIGDFVESRLPVGQITADCVPSVETLSIHPKTGAACWQPVRHVFKRKNAELMRLKTGMGRTLTVTKDHPVLTLDGDEWRIRLAHTLKTGEKIPLSLGMPIGKNAASEIDLIALLERDASASQGVYIKLPQDWTPTEALRVALRPIVPSACSRCSYLNTGRMPLAIFLQVENLFGVERQDIRLFRPSGRANYMRAVITPDDAFARFLGYYLAEGCVSRNGGTEKIIFTFAHHEEAFVNEVAATLKTLGLTPRRERRESTLVVYASSWLLGHLLRTVWKCGVGSVDKAIPAFAFDWPDAMRWEIVKGLFRGDGCIIEAHGGSHAKVSFATASATLFEQMIALLHHAGVVPSIYTRKGGVGAIQGRAVSFRDTYHLEITNAEAFRRLQGVFTGDRDQTLSAAIERYTSPQFAFPRFTRRDNLAAVAITGIEPIENPDDVTVYDVEVEGTHLFVTSGGIVTHNCVGVPTIGGEIYFHPCYNGNPLVNAMSAGVVRTDAIASAKSRGAGNPVLYVGSATGRDGIHGATFASVELTEESQERRPNVQVGDPFTEKLLIEATLEALNAGRIVAIQDMGAAGLTCATCEMAAKGGMGMTIDVQLVPRRETGMTAYETMLSESQERMLAVVEKGYEEEVLAVFQKWGLSAAYIGTLNDSGRVVVKDGGVVEADVSAKSLADDCPTYYLNAAEPEYIARVQNADLSQLPEPDDYNAVLLSLLSSPSIASKRWVWEQYDTSVQTQTETGPGRGDAAVLSVREAGGRRIALTTDCNPRYCYLDPYVGAQIAVAEAARNLSCVGAVPKATTDCLNFPSPEKPAGFWQFQQAVNGMAAACDALKAPVVSGNVSFYNETPEGAIYPTPTVGMVGVFDEGVTPCGLAFQNDGDLIYLLRPTNWEGEDGIGGSEYLSLIHGRDEGKPPRLDLAAEAKVQSVVRQAIAKNLLHSAHDCADGGAAVALAESCLAGNKGAEIRFAIADYGDQKWSAILFGEATARILVTVGEGTAQNALLDLAESSGIEAIFLGQVKGNDRFDAAGLIDLPLAALRDAYEGAIPRIMGK